MKKRRQNFLCVTAGCCLALTARSHAALFTNSVSIDAFVRSNAPTVNYGGAGSLTISGATATNGLGAINGIADSFIRFDTAALMASLNSQYGPGSWLINGVTLRVVEVGAPSNNIFTRGKGAFSAFWISNDDWIEGSGMPMTPTADGITYTNESTLLTNTASLGTFTNAAANSTNFYSLLLPPPFLDDISAGGEVGLYFTAASPEIGFTFDSQNFNTASQRPVLIISAVQRPTSLGISLAGSNLSITATNVAAGKMYLLLSTTDPFAPVDQWHPVSTNLPAENGEISISQPIAPETTQQYFILQAQ